MYRTENRFAIGMRYEYQLLVSEHKQCGMDQFWREQKVEKP